MNTAQSANKPQVDAFTAEVIRSALVAITGEMKTNLMRTAYHTIIYEAEDFTVGLFDGDGNTISIGLGLPMFIRGLSDAIKAKIAHWGKENIEPGDILLTNDSYTMGSHLNHLIFTLPIFNDGELVAFSSAMAHWQDVGGQLGGVTRDIFSEGLQMPFVKSFRAGKENPEITAIIKANVRVPERAMGDMRAQLASIRTGERAFDFTFGMHNWDYYATHPDLGALFDTVMSANTVPIAGRIADAFDFSRFPVIADIGGGDGTLLMAILRRFTPLVEPISIDEAHWTITSYVKTEPPPIAIRLSGPASSARKPRRNSTPGPTMNVPPRGTSRLNRGPRYTGPWNSMRARGFLNRTQRLRSQDFLNEEYCMGISTRYAVE